MKEKLFEKPNKAIMTMIFITIILMVIGECVKDSKYYLYIIEYFILTSILFLKEGKNLFNIKIIFACLFTFMIGLSPLFFYLKNGEVVESQLNIIIISYMLYVLGTFMIIKTENKDSSIDINNQKIQIIAIILGFVALLANLVYIIENRSLLFGGNLEKNRITALSSNGIILLLGNLNLPAIGMLFYNYLENKKNKGILIFFIITAIIMAILKGSRTPIIRILGILILMYNTKKHISNKKIIILVITIILLLTSLQLLRNQMSNENSNSLYKELVNILQNGSVNFGYVLNTFPDKVDFQYGYTYLINIIMLKPGPDMDFTLWLKEQVGLEFDGGGLTPTILGEAYMNFNVWGCYIIMFLIGVLANYLNNKYYSEKYSFWTSYFLIIFIDVFRGGLANIEVSILLYISLYIGLKLYTNIEKRIQRT